MKNAARSAWYARQTAAIAGRAKLRAALMSRLIESLEKGLIDAASFDYDTQAIFAGGYDSFAAEARELREVLAGIRGAVGTKDAVLDLLRFLDNADATVGEYPR